MAAATLGVAASAALDPRPPWSGTIRQATDQLVLATTSRASNARNIGVLCVSRQWLGSPSIGGRPFMEPQAAGPAQLPTSPPAGWRSSSRPPTRRRRQIYADERQNGNDSIEREPSLSAMSPSSKISLQRSARNPLGGSPPSNRHSKHFPGLASQILQNLVSHHGHSERDLPTAGAFTRSVQHQQCRSISLSF